MKKILTIILGICMVLVFTACDTKEDTDIVIPSVLLNSTDQTANTIELNITVMDEDDALSSMEITISNLENEIEKQVINVGNNIVLFENLQSDTTYYIDFIGNYNQGSNKIQFVPLEQLVLVTTELECPQGQYLEEGNCVDEEVLTDLELLINSIYADEEYTLVDLTSEYDFSSVGVTTATIMLKSDLSAVLIYEGEFQGYNGIIKYAIFINEEDITDAFVVLEQSETPSIGGMIEEESFTSTFVGKSVNDYLNNNIDSIAGVSAPVTLQALETALFELFTYHNLIFTDHDFTIGFVTDGGSLDDDSYNEKSWLGVLDFVEDYNLGEVGAVALIPENYNDYYGEISSLYEMGSDIIVLPGFIFWDALEDAKVNLPSQNFVILDMVVEGDNIASVVFKEEEGSFLAGVAAALKAQEAGKDTVGYIGGMDFDLIQKFEAGFEAGVWAVDPSMTVLVDYVGSFADPNMGQNLAASQYDQGAYVIYHTAGGSSNGILLEAKNRTMSGDEVWVIGVDIDQYTHGLYDTNQSVVLTSMLKNLDVATYDVLEATYNDEFPGGEILVYGVAENGVGLPNENPNISQQQLTIINSYRELIGLGEIVVPTIPSRLK